MNRTIPLPLTGGVPQPLTDLSDCIISAECMSPSTIEADGQGVRIGQMQRSNIRVVHS